MTQMKWLVVAAILVYLGLRVYVYFRPRTTVARFLRRRYLLRTDAAAMSRRELWLSAASFFAFAVAAAALYLGVAWGTADLGWAIFSARPVVVAAKAGLFVGSMAAAACLFLVGAAVFRREGS